MPLFRRTVVTFSFAILLPSFVLAQDAGRLTSASNVRLRTEPGETATVVVAVPLGTALVGIETGGDDRAWLRVRTPEGKEGWVLSRLTRRFEGDKRLDVVEQIVAERIARKGDSFAARVEVVDLVERTMADVNDAERAGRLAVLWIGAMHGAAAALPMKYRLNDPHASWVEAHKSAVWWNEVGANWMLSGEALADLHQRHRASSSADAIAWAAVENGLGGECEGYLPCYVERGNLLQGEYLRRHPNGKRAGEAVSDIGKLAELWLTRIDKPDAFSADKDCGELKKSLTPLRAAVASTSAADRDATLGRLDLIGKSCGGTVEERVAAAVEPAAAAVSPAPSPAPTASASSRTISASLFGIAGVGLAGIAAMVMMRRRGSPPSNRITL
jgi:hypothetical protein